MKKSILILSIFLFSISLIAQPMGRMNKMGDPSKRPIIAKLNLTPEQEKQFNDITIENQKKVIDLKAQIEKNRLELKKMVGEGKIDEKKLVDLTDANSKLQGDIKSLAVKRWIAINKILNDDQKLIWSKHLGMMGQPNKMMGMMKERVKDRMKDRMTNKMK
ncbi:MAG: periplasmic heavy metal sensor [Ignavibacteria bacterium]|nr:periplasmic heavy metal sensor [Ignavibacteria bacterium]